MATKAGRYDEVLFSTRGTSGTIYALNADTVSVEVFESDGTTNATLYDDRDKTAYSGTGSVVTPDSAGNIEFFADPGIYVLKISDDGTLLRTDTVNVSVDGTEAGDFPSLSSDETVTGAWSFPTANIDTLRSKGPVLDATHPDYGAVGDGTTDDTTAIQAAIDAAGYGGTVLLPLRHRITASLTIPNAICLMGAGRPANAWDTSATEASAILVDTTDDAIIIGGTSDSELQTGAFNYVEGVTLKNLSIDEYTVGGANSGDGIVIDGSNTLDADRAYARDIILDNVHVGRLNGRGIVTLGNVFHTRYVECSSWGDGGGLVNVDAAVNSGITRAGQQTAIDCFWYSTAVGTYAADVVDLSMIRGHVQGSDGIRLRYGSQLHQAFIESSADAADTVGVTIAGRAVVCSPASISGYDIGVQVGEVSGTDTPNYFGYVGILSARDSNSAAAVKTITGARSGRLFVQEFTGTFTVKYDDNSGSNYLRINPLTQNVDGDYVADSGEGIGWQNGGTTGAKFVWDSGSDEVTLEGAGGGLAVDGADPELRATAGNLWLRAPSGSNIKLQTVGSPEAAHVTTAGFFEVLRRFHIADGVEIHLGTTTGTKIGRATNQKIGFFNATPVVQQTAPADATGTDATQINAIRDALVNLGLMA